MTHFIAIVSDKLQDIEGVSRSLSRQVDIPRIFWFSVHYVSPDEPLDVAFLTFVLLVSDGKETAFSLFVITH